MKRPSKTNVINGHKKINYFHHGIGRALQQIRCDYKIKSQSLAVALNIEYGTWRMIESGNTMFPIDHLLTVCKFFPEISFSHFTQIICLARSFDMGEQDCFFDEKSKELIACDPQIEPLVLFFKKYGEDYLQDPNHLYELGKLTRKYLTNNLRVSDLKKAS